jgi:hypothetical protein
MLGGTSYLKNLPKNTINFEKKRVLIGPEEADTTKGKKVVTMNDLANDKIKKNSKILNKKEEYDLGTQYL